MLLLSEQFIAVFQPGKRRHALPLIRRQGVERLVRLPPGVGPAANYPDILRQSVIALVTYQLKMEYPRYARCLAQDLLQEIKKTLVPIQTGKAEAQPFFCPMPDEVEGYCEQQESEDM